jgi:hypothetical protein
MKWIELKLLQAQRLLGYLSPLRPEFKYDFNQATEKYKSGERDSFKNAYELTPEQIERVKNFTWKSVLWTIVLWIIKIGVVIVIIYFLYTLLKNLLNKITNKIK